MRDHRAERRRQDHLLQPDQRILPPTSGSITFDGRDITKLATHQRVTLGMARTFQITEIFPELTVFENVRIAAEVAGGYRLRPWINRSEAAQINQRVVQTLKLVSLEARGDRR